MCEIQLWLPLERPLLGTWHVALASALTGYGTRHLSVLRRRLHALSPTRQGSMRASMEQILAVPWVPAQRGASWGGSTSLERCSEVAPQLP